MGCGQLQEWCVRVLWLTLCQRLPPFSVLFSALRTPSPLPTELQQLVAAAFRFSLSLISRGINLVNEGLNSWESELFICAKRSMTSSTLQKQQQTKKNGKQKTVPKRHSDLFPCVFFLLLSLWHYCFPSLHFIFFFSFFFSQHTHILRSWVLKSNSVRYERRCRRDVTHRDALRVA